MYREGVCAGGMPRAVRPGLACVGEQVQASRCDTRDGRDGTGMAGLKRDGRHRSCCCVCAGQRRCRCPGDSLGVCSKSSCSDRLGADAVEWPGDVALDLGDVVELLRKSLMNVPERANVTAKRASAPDRREASVVEFWDGTDRFCAAVGRQGRHIETFQRPYRRDLASGLPAPGGTRCTKARC